MAKRAALILAGGSGRRFQAQNQPWQDKILSQVDGKPLLVHAIENLRNAVDEVAICVNTDERKQVYSQILDRHVLVGVKFVLDRKDSPLKGGPILAINSGLHAVSATHCLTVPADMPFVKPQVAGYLFAAAEGFDVAVPMWPDGTVETLLTVLDRKNAIEITDTLCALDKPRANNLIRGASKQLFVSPLEEIKTLDPEFRSFVNINTKEDLIALPTRPVNGKVTENRSINKGKLPATQLQRLRNSQKLMDEGKFLEAQSTLAVCAKSFEAEHLHFWAAISAEKQGEALLKMEGKRSTKFREALLQAARNYQAEAEMYATKGCRVLAQCALADEAWCRSPTAV